MNLIETNHAINFLQVGFAVSCLLFMTVLTIIMVRYNRKRNQRDRLLAEALGFIFQNKPDQALIERIKRTYQTSQRVKVNHAFLKSTPMEQIYLCDVSYYNMQADNGELDYRTVCLLSPRIDLPFFIMLYQFDQVYGPAGNMLNQILEKTLLVMGMTEVSFDLQPQFSKKYQVFGFDEKEIRKVFTHNLIQNLTGTENWLVRAEKDCICFNTYQMRRGETISMNELSEHIRHAQQFAQWIQPA
jgi:hypothetical protein